MPLNDPDCACAACQPTKKTGEIVVTTIPGGIPAIRAKPKRGAPKAAAPAAAGKRTSFRLDTLPDGTTSITTERGLVMHANADCDRFIGLLLGKQHDDDVTVELFVDGVSVVKTEECAWMQLSDYIHLFEAIMCVEQIGTLQGGYTSLSHANSPCSSRAAAL